MKYIFALDIVPEWSITTIFLKSLDIQAENIHLFLISWFRLDINMPVGADN